MTEITFRSDVKVELLDSMGDEQSIVRAARVSTKGSDAELEEAAGLVKFLVREGHTTPLESCVLTFRIECPLFVQNQLVKHRITSINAHSGRYSEMKPEFYVPDSSRPVVQVGKTGDYEFVGTAKTSKAARGILEDASDYAWERYKYALDQGIAKEVARLVLPQNIYSSLVLTANLHSLLNIVRLRTDRYGSKPQHEIALLGEAIRDVLVGKFPNVMEAYESK